MTEHTANLSLQRQATPSWQHPSRSNRRSTPAPVVRPAFLVALALAALLIL